MSKLKVRVTSALIGAVFVLGMTFAMPSVFHIAVAIACFIMLYELHDTFGIKGKRPLLLLNYLFAAVLLFAQAFLSRDNIVLVLTAYLMLLLTATVLFYKTVHFSDAAYSFFAMVYSVLLPMHLIGIRVMEHGVALIFLAFLGAWMPDTFAYFSGSLLGKHKLIPAVSPNKTVEGAVGAVLGAVISFLVFALVTSIGFGYSVRYPALLVLALICGVTAQLGDLSASVIKRECHKKDFGNFLPGHGGILDRIDSLVFIAPVVYYFLQNFEVIYK